MDKSENMVHAQINLADVREGSTGPVTVMVCRKWDVMSVNGRYMSTDYIVSDKKGNMMHCTAKNNIAHIFFDKLKEGGVYVIRGFTVQRTDQYRIIKDNPFVIGLHGLTVVKRADDDAKCFDRHPFLLTSFEDLQPTEGNYFVDVIGYVTEIDPQSVKASGARTVEFNLTNEHNRQVRVTLWGSLGDAMLKKKGDNPAVYSVILTSMTAKFYLSNLCLSSSSSSMIIDSDDIPAIQSFKSSLSCVHVGETGHPITEAVVCVDTLQEFMDKVRADKTKKKVILFKNALEITGIRTKNSWYFFTCSGSKCRKGLTREGGHFVCKGCKLKVDYPKTRFRIQADVTDGTMNTVVVIFDEVAEQLTKRTAKSLVDEQLQDTTIDGPLLPTALESLIGTKHIFEIKSHTYYHFGEYESFNCAKIVPLGVDDSIKGVSTVTPNLDSIPTTPLKRPAPISTPPPKAVRKLRKLRVIESDEDTDENIADDVEVTGVVNATKDDDTEDAANGLE